MESDRKYVLENDKDKLKCDMQMIIAHWARSLDSIAGMIANAIGTKISGAMEHLSVSEVCCLI